MGRSSHVGCLACENFPAARNFRDGRRSPEKVETVKWPGKRCRLTFPVVSQSTADRARSAILKPTGASINDNSYTCCPERSAAVASR